MKCSENHQNKIRKSLLLRMYFLSHKVCNLMRNSCGKNVIHYFMLNVQCLQALADEKRFTTILVQFDGRILISYFDLQRVYSFSKDKLHSIQIPTISSQNIPFWRKIICYTLVNAATYVLYKPQSLWFGEEFMWENVTYYFRLKIWCMQA